MAIDRRVVAKMELVLEEAFAGVPHGGDHKNRKYVAEKLIRSAEQGNVTLDGLRAIGREAFQKSSARQLA
jgi:hypothetical protein